MKKYLLLSILLVFVGLFFLYRSENPQEDATGLEQSMSLVAEEKKMEKAVLYHPDTIPAMSEKEFMGSDLELKEILEENDSYTRHSITYKSEGFTVSGIIIIPKGSGPFPILVLNHGYVDPKAYTNGHALLREQDFFARRGYAILYSDYRGHALSDIDPNNEVRPRSGYVEDVLSLISAVKKADIPLLDKENIGMLGFSMGGGITLNVMVTKPEIAKAYVLLAPIHSNYKVNFDRWVPTEWPEVAEEFYRRYGTYEENPSFWHDISAQNFFSRITSPVMLHQGTRDGEVPVEWSRDLAERLKQEGKDVTYYEYPGEPHIFGKSQELAMQRTLIFLDTHLKKE